MHIWPAAPSRLWTEGLESQPPGLDLPAGTAWLWFWVSVLSQVASPLSFNSVNQQLLTKCPNRHFCTSFHTWLQVFTMWNYHHPSNNLASLTMTSRYVDVYGIYLIGNNPCSNNSFLFLNYPHSTSQLTKTEEIILSKTFKNKTLNLRRDKTPKCWVQFHHLQAVWSWVNHLNPLSFNSFLLN